MNPCIVHSLAVVSIYYAWRLYALWLVQRQQKLRERVTYMLWTAAQEAGGTKAAVGAG